MDKAYIDNEKKDYGLVGITFYSFLSNYGRFLFLIIITSIMARFLSPYEWGILILSQSIIAIWIIISDIFPPGLNYSLNYYVPKFIASREYLNLKSIIVNSIKQKLLILIPFFIIGLILITLFPIGYLDNMLIIYILSPQIILQSLNLIFTSISFGYKLYKALFFIDVIQNIFHIASLIGLLILGKFSIIFISIVLTINVFINLILKFFVLRKKINLILKSGNISNKYKEDLKKNLKYGIPVVIAGEIGTLWTEVKKQSIGAILDPSIVTIYNIGENLAQFPLISSVAFHQPIISHFSGLDHEKDKKKIEDLFVLIYEFALLLTCIVTGVFIFFIEFYTLIVYGNNYLLYVFYFQLIAIAIAPRVLGGLLSSLLSAKHKVKIFPLLAVIYNGILIISFIIGIYYFQLYGYSYSLIIAVFIIFIIQFKFTKKLGGIKLPIKKTIVIFIIFFDSLIISYFIIYTIIPNLFLLNSIIGAGIFVILIFIQMLFFKILTLKELELMESFFEKETKPNIIIKKCISLLKRIVRK